MNNNDVVYSTLVLFGKEGAQSVAEVLRFEDVAGVVADVLSATGCKLAGRGWIEGEKGKNVAPRKGTWSAALGRQWAATLGKGRFKAIELFDREWREGNHPAAYGAIRKLWGYGPSGYFERTKDGAENHIVIAIREDLVTDSLERLEAVGRSLIEKIKCFYGSVESNVPWDRPRGQLREDMIDLRWYNRLEGDYRRGTFKVDEMVPRLYRGNILSRRQFLTSELQELNLVKLAGVERVESWPGDLVYLRLAEQPEYGAKPLFQFAELIRFIPE
jgi:hypothetical protein